jgi:hypothetical protein
VAAAATAAVAALICCSSCTLLTLLPQIRTRLSALPSEDKQSGELPFGDKSALDLFADKTAVDPSGDDVIKLNSGDPLGDKRPSETKLWLPLANTLSLADPFLSGDVHLLLPLAFSQKLPSTEPGTLFMSCMENLAAESTQAFGDMRSMLEEELLTSTTGDLDAESPPMTLESRKQKDPLGKSEKPDDSLDNACTSWACLGSKSPTTVRGTGVLKLRSP